jgi:hypothetical protein
MKKQLAATTGKAPKPLKRTRRSLAIQAGINAGDVIVEKLGPEFPARPAP